MNQEKRKILTLCIIHEHPRVLLGMKKKGFGEGKWNGFGGKLEKGESIEEACLRELHEEAGIAPKTLIKLGVLDFRFQKNPHEVLEVHIFKGHGIEGEPRESDEMHPAWFHVDDVPFQKMWPDDIHWFPLFLADKRFNGTFLFGDGDAIIEKELTEI
ncbi:MAG: hypothetical protein A3D67_03230 [Candidatus Lloydbacteria bacterium RIFCSPHIGHO2_02_FULL_51_22]|uniref:Oxidized purine nucleoside triphosphate hydrolase n=3 Tax=Candidatus Lloydiibacteriota TaxID=1817910 RepID=A0A1G2DC64_9BACT|nr:MAG: hypothetical protein A3D67_03230 [Candidatus Lloydbacteria bacterium RIFCSPHIGHO2_02_FULL_51_22]OGZ15684.1 MAG: hypothetical protein A3J08_01375 [Candidatus Lloydbacteria bacterium RIFCSPLOWO2_02_FULL_51_11]OGZ15915.1 MAG: hypothetical protein A3G11_02375 [Candidatus Lloydbacteria bacterium RIFCSPLOWO2_12_FULL_51_9]